MKPDTSLIRDEGYIMPDMVRIRHAMYQWIWLLATMHHHFEMKWTMVYDDILGDQCGLNVLQVKPASEEP